MKKWLTIDKYITSKIERFFWVMLGMYALSLWLAPDRSMNIILLSINYFAYRIVRELIEKDKR